MDALVKKYCYGNERKNSAYVERFLRIGISGERTYNTNYAGKIRKEKNIFTTEFTETTENLKNGKK